MDTSAPPQLLGDEFPIEEARLLSARWLVITASAAIVGYGWSIQYKLVSIPHLRLGVY